MQRTPRHFDLKSFTFIFVTLLTFTTSISCAPGTAALDQSSSNSSSSTKPPPTATPKPTSPTPTPPPSSGGVTLKIPALWESQVKGSNAWSTYAAAIVDSKCPALLDGAKDMASFCPKYASLSHDQKVNVWVFLVSAITKYESGFDPTSRYKESTMGTDPITGQPVYSEGLLQLSYQDQQGYSFCKVFDWSIDKNLSPTDPKKTILNPYLNLECGIQILNHQIERYDQIGIQSGAYWSTLRPNGTKLSLIKALVKGMGICQ